MFAAAARRAWLPPSAAAAALAAAAAAAPLAHPRGPSPPRPGPRRRCAAAVRTAARCEETLSTGTGSSWGAVKFGGGADEFHAAYEVEEEIGRGTYGVVARVRHRQTRELRAMKRVRAAAPRRTFADASPVGEVGALARLDHPNVARLIEHYATQDEVLLVQELCSGTSLEARLHKTGRMAAEEAAAVMRQMLEAVNHCHKQHVIHRDLKADNFVFESEESEAAVKLIDFGLADRCEMGQFLDVRGGTIEYSAPEVLGHNGAGFGLPADLWALGAVLFLMLTGEPLIQVENPRSPDEVVRQMLRQEAREKVCGPRYVRLRLQAVSMRIPLPALDLLESLLARDPEKRMTAAEALRHPFVQGEGCARPLGAQ